MIIGDSTACSEYAFHPTITKPPAADDNNNRGDNTPIDPSAVWAVVASEFGHGHWSSAWDDEGQKPKTKLQGLSFG